MEEKIKTLPQNSSSWLNDTVMYNYQGHWNFQHFIEGTILAQESFKAQPTDKLICSCPKTGTIWLKALVFAIVTREKFDESTTPLLTTMPHECIPFLESHLDQVKTNHQSGFPLIATHLPYPSLPQSVIASDCKIVYIYGNTKDVIVSYYHFMRKMLNVPEEESSFEEAFEEFCQGISHYGPYWDHLLGYWKASLERPRKILLLKYEDMKKDTLCNVKRLAEFIGYPFSIAEEKAGVIEKIMELCSFENLSNLEVNKSGGHRSLVENRADNGKTAIQNRIYFRKAKAGDWENYFTEEMKQKVDKLMEEKLSGTGLVLK